MVDGDGVETTAPRSLRIFTTKRSRQRTIGVLVLVAVIFLAGSLVVDRYVPGLADVETLRGIILSFGALAPIAFVLIQAAQVVVAPVPGQLLGFVAGYLFGGLAGATYSLIGAALGSFVAFSISRRYGRPFVETVVYGPTLAAFDEACRDRGMLALFIIFLVPGLPDDVLCFAAGLTDLDIRKMVVVSVLGRIPGYGLVAFAGANLADGNTLETIVLVGVIAIVSIAGILQRDRILGWLGAETPTDPHDGG